MLRGLWEYLQEPGDSKSLTENWYWEGEVRNVWGGQAESCPIVGWLKKGLSLSLSEKGSVLNGNGGQGQWRQGPNSTWTPVSLRWQSPWLPRAPVRTGLECPSGCKFEGHLGWEHIDSRHTHSCWKPIHCSSQLSDGTLPSSVLIPM